MLKNLMMMFFGDAITSQQQEQNKALNLKLLQKYSKKTVQLKHGLFTWVIIV